MADPMSASDVLEQVGLLADTVDNLLAAESIPFPEHIAKRCRIAALTKLRDELRTLYVGGSGDNPWSTPP